jgi:hypothetical protein
MVINTNIKEGPNRLFNFIERYGGNISDIFQRFFEYSGNPLAYGMWLVAEIEFDQTVQLISEDIFSSAIVR